MIRVFSKRLDVNALLGLQVLQYSEKLLLSGVVPANSSLMAKSTVSNLGHFLCLFVTGKYTTLNSITDPVKGAQVIDTGIQYLRGQMIDGAGQKKLFNDYIPLDLILSPGRVKADCTNAYTDNLDTTASQPREIALAAAAGQALFYPTEFEYLFSANSEVLFDVKNASNVDNTFEIVLHGIRILAAASVKGVRQRL